MLAYLKNGNVEELLNPLNSRGMAMQELKRLLEDLGCLESVEFELVGPFTKGTTKYRIKGLSKVKKNVITETEEYDNGNLNGVFGVLDTEDGVETYSEEVIFDWASETNNTFVEIYDALWAFMQKTNDYLRYSRPNQADIELLEIDAFRIAVRACIFKAMYMSPCTFDVNDRVEVLAFGTDALTIRINGEHTSLEAHVKKEVFVGKMMKSYTEAVVLAYELALDKYETRFGTDDEVDHVSVCPTFDSTSGETKLLGLHPKFTKEGETVNV